MRAWASVLATLLCGVLAANASCAMGASAGRAIDLLNRQRAANGIPAGLVERPDWSHACALHNRYERINHVLAHDEDPQRPGYTRAGAWAGQNSVLGQGTNWNHTNPWLNAPIHLDQLLAVRLTEIGVDDTAGWTCATTFPGLTRTPPDTPAVFTYPGPGRLSVNTRERSNEQPFTPEDFVGLAHRVTGPHLYVLADSPGDYPTARILGATLTGPTGDREVRWIDNTSRTIGPYLISSGIIIPRSPLRPGTWYTAQVTLRTGGATLTHTWQFRTRRGRR